MSHLLNSPAFTGTPTAPTADAADNSTQLSTTAFVKAQGYIPSTQKGAANGVAPLNASSKIDITYLPDSMIGGMTYQGTWNATTNSPTIPAASSSNKGYYYKVATAGTTNVDGIAQWDIGDWIVSNGTTWDKIDNSEIVTSVAGKTGAVTLAVADVSGAAPLASPALTGTPTAPTAAANTNTTQIATTAFVVGQAGTASPVMDGTATEGTSLLYSRQDHIHPSDTSRQAALSGTGFVKISGTTISYDNNTYAPLASPTFTGTPAAPTAAVDTSTTQIATTAFVVNQGYLKSATAASTYAPLASPALTGTPTAPTAAQGTNTTQLATTAFVQAALQTQVSAISTKTGAYTVTNTDSVILANATTAAFTVTLPATPTTGLTITIKKIDSTANAVTVSGNSKTIDGSSSIALNAQYQSWTLVYDGTAWYAI